MCFCTCVQEKGEVKRPTDDGRHSQVVSRLTLVFQTYGVRPELQIKPEKSTFIENVGCIGQRYQEAFSANIDSG